MTEGFSDWLRTSLERRGWSQGQLAVKIGVSPATVSRWLSGGRPDPEYVGRLAQAFEESVQKIYALAGHPAVYDPPPRQSLSPEQTIIEALADIPILVPVLDQLASAGEGQVALDYAALPRTRAVTKNIGAIAIRGTSMEPDVHDGDTVIFDRDAVPRSGDIVVASVDDQVYIKRLEQKSDGHWMLVGNDGKLIDADAATIAGVVLQAVRDVRRR